MLYTSMIALVLTFLVIYLNIDSKIRKMHSKSFMKKNMTSIFDRIFFRNFLKEINKVEYIFLIICYSMSLVGIIVGVFELIGFIDSTSKFYSIFSAIIFVADLILFTVKIIFVPLIDALKSDKSSLFLKLIILLMMAVNSVLLVALIIYFLF